MGEGSRVPNDLIFIRAWFLGSYRDNIHGNWFNVHKVVIFMGQDYSVHKQLIFMCQGSWVYKGIIVMGVRVVGFIKITCFIKHHFNFAFLKV